MLPDGRSGSSSRLSPRRSRSPPCRGTVPSPHEEIDDPKVQKNVADNRRWYAERRNAEMFGPRALKDDSQPQLIGILQAAVNRLIEAVPPAAPMPLMVEGRAELVEAKRFGEDDPAEAHRP